MKVIQTIIPDVFIFEPEVYGDNRGYFFESFREDVIKEYIGEVNFVQDNESLSSYGVLRGLHFQKPPYTQAKLVRVIEGEVLDVVVDIRKNSPTYGKNFTVKLSSEKKNQLFVPKGFAHGFAVLSPKAIFAYKCDEYYNPQSEDGINYDDKQLDIDWILPKKDILLSEKDKHHQSFSNIKGI